MSFLNLLFTLPFHAIKRNTYQIVHPNKKNRTRLQPILTA